MVILFYKYFHSMRVEGGLMATQNKRGERSNKDERRRKKRSEKEEEPLC